MLNRPPQTPKFPPRTGARALIAVMAPMRRSPYGELRNCRNRERERYETLKVGTDTLNTVPNSTSNSLDDLLTDVDRAYRAKTYTHGEGAAKIVQDHPWTRVASMVHSGEVLWIVLYSEDWRGV